jgi:uncharacterized protein YtpQ (UPF0354 family)
MSDLSKVVPRIKETLARGAPADLVLSQENSPVLVPLVADLTVAYAFDMGDHYVFVANKDLPRLGVSAEELHARALQNLRALNLNVQAHSGEGIMALTAGGNYEATLLLLPEIWEAIGPMVEGRMIVSVPARDIVYVTGDSNQENLASLRRWTSKMLENADKPMSRTFLVWTESRWTEYDGFAS